MNQSELRHAQETAEILRKQQQEKLFKDMSAVLRHLDDIHLQKVQELVQTEIESR